MGFFAFFFKSPLGIVLGIFSSLFFLAALIVAVTGTLAFTGGPGPCTPGGASIDISDANAQSFQAKWDQLDAALAAGAPASATITESEASSRAEQYITEHDSQVSDIRVCIHNGYGEVTGKVDAFITDAKFKVSGSVDLSGDHPKATFDDVEVGNVPGFVLGPLKTTVQDAIQNLLDDIDLKHHYSVTLEDGAASVSGTP